MSRASATSGSYFENTWRLTRDAGRLAALRWLWMYTFGRFVAVRRLCRVMRPSRGRDPESAGFRSLVSRLEEDGIDWSLSLPAATVSRLVELACKQAASRAYPSAQEGGHPWLDRAAAESGFAEIASAYLGTAARYAGCRMWWLDADNDDALAVGTRFHYDLYDYGALAFLCFLTDVQPGSGAHVCVRSSHRRRSLRDQLRLRRHWPDQDVLETYGPERIVTVTGSAGTVIAEDPFCIHKALTPTIGRRLAVQFLYTASNRPAPSFALPARRTSTTR